MKKIIIFIIIISSGLNIYANAIDDFKMKIREEIVIDGNSYALNSKQIEEIEDYLDNHDFTMSQIELLKSKYDEIIHIIKEENNLDFNNYKKANKEKIKQIFLDVIDIINIKGSISKEGVRVFLDNNKEIRLEKLVKDTAITFNGTNIIELIAIVLFISLGLLYVKKYH